MLKYCTSALRYKGKRAILCGLCVYVCNAMSALHHQTKLCKPKRLFIDVWFANASVFQLTIMTALLFRNYKQDAV